MSDCDDLEAGEETTVDLGINYRSILFELEYFDVDVLVPDVMHDLLEGVLQYEASLILKYVIKDQCYMTYTAFSNAMHSLELGYMEADNRPTDIPPATLNSSDKSLGQKGVLLMAGYQLYMFACLHYAQFYICSCHSNDVAVSYIHD